MREGRLRRTAIAAALAVLALVPLAAWGAGELGSEDREELIVEHGPGGVAGNAELVVMLPSAELNATETTGGESTVVLACLDADGDVEFRVVQPFPFTDTDGGTASPHSHELVPSAQFSRIERCRLEGTTPALEGALREPASR